MTRRAIILGIDPGTRRTGFGAIEKIGTRYQLLDYGVITPKASLSIEKRYQVIYDEISLLVLKLSPSALSVETQFMHKNVKSAMTLGIARGMVMLAAAKNDIPLFEYAPKKAKMAVSGNGAASKEQVGRMIATLLGLKKPPAPEDAADALSLAICHAHHYREST